MIKYIIPFGCDCYIALTLDAIKLRKYSLPFDFIYSDINMIKECLDTNFKEFLNSENYNKYQRKGCVNKYFKKKFPHFNMLDKSFYETMEKRINRFKFIIKTKEKKLFIHIYAKYKKSYIDQLENIINKHSNNFEILILIKKRRNYNSVKLDYQSKNIKVFTIFTKTKAIPNDIINNIFDNYNFDLYNIKYIEKLMENNDDKIIKKIEIKKDDNIYKKNKTLVLYSYCELSKTKDLRKRNLEFFINKGILDNNDIDFKIIVNGHQISVDTPNLKNVEIIKRDNVSFDFGGYSSVILNIDYSKYDYFIFLNDSVRGPYLLNWFPKKYNWTELFTSKLDKNTKLVGATINFHKGNPHVNSEMFSTDLIGLKVLIENKIISTEVLKKKPVFTRELKQSRIMLENNYNIACMLEAYKDVDFRKFKGNDYKKNPYLNANFKGSCDPLYRRRYFGMSITPFETIFFKTNRDINNRMMDKYSEWILNGNKCNK